VSPDGDTCRDTSGDISHGPAAEPHLPLRVRPEGREPDFSRDLLTAVVQDALSREVLMVAHMDRDAYTATLATGRATFWSRRRQRLWEKGETSGHTLRVVEARLDCDGDAVLLLVEPAGPACHTGATTCFTAPSHDAASMEVGGER
jgi:phosphoribosyl-AMP cyclohydrolase